MADPKKNLAKCMTKSLSTRTPAPGSGRWTCRACKSRGVKSTWPVEVMIKLKCGTVRYTKTDTCATCKARRPMTKREHHLLFGSPDGKVRGVEKLVHGLAIRTYRQHGGKYALDLITSLAFYGAVRAAQTFSKSNGFEFTTYVGAVVRRHLTRRDLVECFADGKRWLYDELRSSTMGITWVGHGESVNWNDNVIENAVDRSCEEDEARDSARETAALFYKWVEKHARLSVRQRQVLRMRYGIGGKGRGRETSFADIAKELDLSRERIRQIHDAALRQIEREVESTHGAEQLRRIGV